MNKETANNLVEKLNANMGTISNILRENLGIDGKPFIKTSERTNGEVYVYIEEDADTTRHLTATPLLRQMFKKAGLCIRCWYDEQRDTCSFLVNVYYDHAYNGGSNGVELMRFYISFAKGTVLVKTDK